MRLSLFRMRFLAALLIVATAAHAGGRLTVDGRWLRDAERRVVFLHGVNYSQASKHAPYTEWQAPEHFDQVAGWGFNAVRYIVQWAAIEPEPDRIDEAYLDRVERAIAWAEARGLYVLIDMHQDVWAEPFGGNGAPKWACVDDLVEPNEILSPWWKNYFTKEVMASFGRFWTDTALQDHYARAWQAVARRARRHANVAGYDLMNEPFPGKRIPWTFEARQLSEFHARIGRAIRAVDPGAILFFEPVAMTANEGLPTAVKAAPKPSVYAPHYYDFLLMLGKPYKHRKWLTERAVRALEAQSRARGVPMVVGEIGCGRGDEGGTDAMSDQCDVLDATLAAGWMAWEYTPDSGPTGPIHQGGMSIVQKGVEHPAMAAFVRPYARAVAGTPRAVKFDRAARTFRLEYAASNGPSPTLVHVPRRHFANPEVRATGRYTLEGETLTHWPDPAAAVQSIVIRARP